MSGWGGDWDGLRPAVHRPPGQEAAETLAQRWRGRADIIRVDAGVRYVAVMRLPGCPPPVILMAGDEDQLERQLTRQTEGGG